MKVRVRSDQHTLLAETEGRAAEDLVAMVVATPQMSSSVSTKPDTLVFRCTADMVLHMGANGQYWNMFFWPGFYVVVER